MNRIKWDLPEAVVLLDVLLSNWGQLSISDEKLLELSEMYKRKARAEGIVYDDKYRNLAGLRMQLACLQYVVSNGEIGMPNAAKIFREAYNLFGNNLEEFKTIKDSFYRLYSNNCNPD